MGGVKMYIELRKKIEVCDGSEKNWIKHVMPTHSQQKNEKLIHHDV